jgi:hypothetical protein
MAESREVVIEYNMLDFGEYMLGLGECWACVTICMPLMNICSKSLQIIPQLTLDLSLYLRPTS